MYVRIVLRNLELMGMISRYLNDEVIRKKCDKLTEPVFLCLCAIYLGVMTLGITMFTFQIPDALDNMLSVLISVVVIIRIIPHYKDKLVWCAVFINVIYTLSWDVEHFATLGVMTLGCIGINYRKILRVYLISVGSVVLCTIIAALCGFIPDLVYIKEGHIRSSMGIRYPTDFASIIFFLIISLWVLWKGLSDELSLIFPALTFVVAYYLAYSTTGIICSAVFAVLIIYGIVEKRYADKHKYIRCIKCVADIVMQAVFPLAGFIMIFITWSYYKGYAFAIFLDDHFTHRFSQPVRAFMENGISAFGAPFKQIGAGGSTYNHADYFFIDSSYIRLFIYYGIVIWLIMSFLWILMTRRAIKSGERRMVMALTLIAVHAMSEHHFMQVFYNIFIILPFAALTEGKEESDNKGKESADRIHDNEHYETIQAGFFAASLIAAFIIILLLVPRLRLLTLSINDQAYVFIAILAIELLLTIAISGVSRFWAGKMCHVRTGISLKAAITISVMFLVLTFVWLTYRIDSVIEKYASLPDGDSAPFEVMLNSKVGKIYVDRLGELYHRRYDGISRSLYDGEELARYKNTTVLVDKELDSPVFLNSGFLYSEISDSHALYTNDEGVINALKMAGYNVSEYCTAVYSLDMKDEAKAQGLDTNDIGDIVLGGKKRTFHAGTGDNPFKIDQDRMINLYSGKYKWIYRLHIDPVPYDMDYKVCKITINAYGGEMDICDVDVYRSMFDENGDLCDGVDFGIGVDCWLIQSWLVMEKGQEGTLKGVTWQRVTDSNENST